jgi:two-component system CheB/CheR fusion protein
MQKKPSGQGAESNGSSTERPADAPGAPGAREPDGAGRTQSDTPAGAASPEPVPSDEDGFPVVGVGASAGGLAAFEAFLSALPSDTGMAFVLVQHLAPNHKSMLVDLVRRYTRMPIDEVVDGLRVRPSRVYIIPPGCDMALLDGRLHLLEPQAPHGLRLPIDFFFRSLAKDRRERAIAVVLSGTGTDGTLGARAVKDEGGLVLAQEPTTATYDGMPRSLIASGVADFILSPEEMPRQLLAYCAHAARNGLLGPVRPAAPTEDTLAKICILLRDHTGHDFSQYKQSTLVRRIERRMALHQIQRQDEFLRYLRQEPAEIEALFRDLLIGVTSFFRDPEAFAALEQDVIPRLFVGKSAERPVRVWVCGCSTGEEAYSIAILLQEHLDQLGQAFPVQLFATDIDANAIAQARAAAFPASIATDITPERLKRFFALDRDAGVYRVQKRIRDLIVFSEQDVIKDPPFSRLDLISCRNLLIYLNSDLQKRLIPLFHYALNPNGVLFLGSSENIGEALTLFTPLSRKWKLYLSTEAALSPRPPPLGSVPRSPTTVAPATSAPAAGARPMGQGDLRGLTEQALLEHCPAAAVLVNARGEILYIHGRTGRYLEPAAGEASMNILTMARQGLRRALVAALQQAVTKRAIVRSTQLRVRANGDVVGVDLTVRPLAPSGAAAALSDRCLVVLEACPPPVPPEPSIDPTRSETARPGMSAQGAQQDEAAMRIAELERELRAKEEYLQATLEEMETAHEELKSTNEETQSINEELQSANEELETSKEELQSVNEELATVNAELQAKVADLSRANNDMSNLLAGTGIATLFVDHQLRITRFTPATTRLIKLIDSDIGRPVGDIVSNLACYEDLEADLQAVLDTLAPQEKEVQSREGAWYLMHIGPYRTLENVIEGAVITFVDISSHKALEDELRRALAFAEAIVDTVREPLLVLDREQRVLSANRAFYRRFGMDPADTEGRMLRALGDGQWDLPALRRQLTVLDSEDVGKLEDLEVELDFAGLGRRTLLLNARLLDAPVGPTGAILLAIEDITAQTGVRS